MKSDKKSDANLFITCNFMEKTIMKTVFVITTMLLFCERKQFFAKRKKFFIININVLLIMQNTKL